MDLKAIRTEQARRSLSHFSRQAWHVLEPATPYVHGWHIDAITEHLEAVTNGEIRKLLINMPPRHMKSLLISVFWPVWEWIAHPERRWLFSAYAQSLSVRDSLKCRRLIESPWFQERWGGQFQLTSDQNAKTRFDNDKTGYRIATSVDAAATGEGGDRVVVDDPHNAREAMSQAKRESTLIWWDETMSTRLNDPKTGAHVIVMQRLHEKDLSGHILEQGGYEHLCLPAEYEPEGARVTCIGWEDPRKNEGELLWPDRFGPAELAMLKRSLGSHAAAGQLQQRPVPAEGGMVKLAWFKRFTTPPANPVMIVQSWDTAQKAKQINDPWVCGTWLVTETGWYLVEVLRRRMEYPEGRRTAIAHAAKWKPDAILIEDKSSGSSLIQELRTETSLPVIAIEPENDKITRMSVQTPKIEAGRVYLPDASADDAEWLADYETELCRFPLVTHDDQTDMTSQFLGWVSKPDDGEPRIY